MVMQQILIFALLCLEFLPVPLALVLGLNSLIFLPLITVSWIVLFCIFNKTEKKKARRMRADGPSGLNTYAENIIHRNDTFCQDGISRLQKKRREVFIYE